LGPSLLRFATLADPANKIALVTGARSEERPLCPTWLAGNVARERSEHNGKLELSHKGNRPRLREWALQFAAVRRQEVDLRSKRHDARGIYLAVTLIIMPFDVGEVYRIGTPGY
jgi:hypothetical protein